MIADSQIYGNITKWIELLRDEVGPFNSLVFGDRKVLTAILRSGKQVLIEIGAGAEVT